MRVLTAVAMMLAAAAPVVRAFSRAAAGAPSWGAAGPRRLTAKKVAEQPVDSPQARVAAMMAAQQQAAKENEAAAGATGWKVNLLYDSDCVLCMKEVEFLRMRDQQGAIKFTDIASLDYDPAENGGVEFDVGMRRIHAVLPDGKVIEGVDVFRHVYEEIGLGWVYAATKVPAVGAFANALYDIWAENRLRITGRPELAEIMKQRREALEELKAQDCTDTCDVGDL